MFRAARVLLSLVFCLYSAQVKTQDSTSQTIELCEQVRNLRQPIFQGSEGWLFRNHIDIAMDLAFDNMLPGIVRLSQALQQQGVTLVIAPVPSRGMVYGDTLSAEDRQAANFSLEQLRAAYRRFVSSLNANNVLAVDLLTPFLEIANQEMLFLKLDGHWTSAGARRTALVLAQHVTMRDAAYAALPKQAFTTTYLESVPRPGGIQALIQQNCAITLADELVEKYVTVPVQTLAQDLFAATTTPVVIVGTSYSGNQFNFPGFLSEYLQLDVVSNFVAGGGLFSAIQDLFLISQWETKPSYLVWEFPVHMIRLDNEDFNNFRLLIPSINGACAASESLVQQTGMPLSATTTLHLTPAAREFSGSNHYLYLQLSDLTVVEFDITVHHNDGTTDTVSVARSTRIQNTGEFFLEFSDAIPVPVHYVTLRVPENAGGTVDARVCAVGL